jgi:hypothetical protein
MVLISAVKLYFVYNDKDQGESKDEHEDEDKDEGEDQKQELYRCQKLFPPKTNF